MLVIVFLFHFKDFNSTLFYFVKNTGLTKLSWCFTGFLVYNKFVSLQFETWRLKEINIVVFFRIQSHAVSL